MAERRKPSFGVIQGGRVDPEAAAVRDHSSPRSLEAEMRAARAILHERLKRAPTSEEVRQHALKLASARHGEQPRARNDTDDDEPPRIA